MANGTNNTFEDNHLNSTKSDRLVKYGFGSIRLLILFSCFIYFDEGFNMSKFGSLNRWIIYVVFALFGACLNVKILNPKVEKLAMMFVLLLAFYDLSYDYTVLLYANKTFIPDFIANKLDRKIWKFLLLLSFSTFLFCYVLNIDAKVFELGTLWFYMALGQLFCELGDQHMEHWTFFRHRYSFEVVNLIIWIYLPYGVRADQERTLFYFDLTASLSYRITGFVLKICDMDKRKIANDNVLKENDKKEN